MKNKTNILTILSIFLLLISLAGCASSGKPEPAAVVLSGLRQGDVTLFTEELKANYDPVLMQCNTAPDSELLLSVTAEGVKLETVLNELGYTLQQFDELILHAGGQEVPVPGEILHFHEILITWSLDGETRNPGIVIPDADAAYWVSDLTQIELITDDETADPIILPGGRA